MSSHKKSSRSKKNNLTQPQERGTGRGGHSAYSVRSRRKGRGRSYGRGRTGRRTKEMIDIAKSRIRRLLTLAETEILQHQNHSRARRYVTLARKIGMRYNVRIEKYFRNNICRSCNSYLVSSTASRVRCTGGRITRYCKNCGKITRVPLHRVKHLDRH